MVHFRHTIGRPPQVPETDPEDINFIILEEAFCSSLEYTVCSLDDNEVLKISIVLIL